jgi:hypothetical protein
MAGIPSANTALFIAGIGNTASPWWLAGPEAQGVRKLV